jgi:fluoride exporter
LDRAKALFMHPLILVMAGGAIGAALRYLSGILLAARLPSAWPWGTFMANLIGGLLMGVLAALVVRGSTSEPMRLFFGVGILGGFTTFSAFSLESFQMVERGQIGLAAAYALASVIGSIAMLGAGFWILKA